MNFFYILVFLFSGAILAQNSTQQKVQKTDKADEVITNKRLRADSGSLSKYSVSTYFNYQGGSLDRPFDATRPNIISSADTLTLQNLSGDVGVRYRATDLLSMTMSGGLFMTTPFHDSIKTDDPVLKENFDENHQKLTVNDPTVRLTYLSTLSKFQSVTNWRIALVTNNQQKLQGYQWTTSILQNFMHQIKDTKFTYGANLFGQIYTFSKENDSLTNRVLYFYPVFEYEINEVFNFRTVLGLFNYQHIRGDDFNTYTKRKFYQSVGIGISVTRDFFLYPNIQYIPSDIRTDRTNFSCSGNINF